MSHTHAHLVRAFVVVMGLALANVALAGPPLICFPFDTDGAPALAWGSGPGWNTPHPSYDTHHLASDTLRLLAADAPVLARMENMRRATIYAMQDPVLAGQVLSGLIDRALSPSGSRDPLAWFDAGYIVESYRQAVHVRRVGAGTQSWAAVDATLASIDGYGFVKKSFALQAPSGEMEFAASLMTTGAVSAAHRARASEAAVRGSLLARNLAK